MILTATVEVGWEGRLFTFDLFQVDVPADEKQNAEDALKCEMRFNSLEMEKV